MKENNDKGDKIMWRRIKNAIHISKSYSFRAYLEMITYGSLRKCPDRREKLFEEYYVKREKKILKFTPSVIDESNNYQPGLKIGSDYKIWMFWWTGFETAPELIRNCVASVKRHANGHEVILLSKDNLCEYIQLPECILDKFEKGIIPITQLSDIIRVTLLEKYGGVWSDATLFYSDSLPDNLAEYTFYTGRRCTNIVGNCVAKSRWTTYFLAGGQHCAVFRFCRDFYFQYWQSSKRLSDYFLTDYVLDIAYRNNATIRKLIDNVPYNSENARKLAQVINTAYDEKVYLSIIKDTNIHKLSRKVMMVPTVDGKNTFYKEIVDNPTK